MKSFFSIVLFCCSLVVSAQNKQILYGLEEVPQNLLLNPGGEVAFKSHFGIPFLSQLHVNAGASGVTVYDILGRSETDINTRIRNKIFELKNTDFFTATQQLEIINIGWRGKNDIYFSAGMYQELDFILYFPRDLAILAWEGNRQYIDYNFDLGDLNTTADLLTVYHFGLNKKISDKWTLGARFKVYSSMFNYRSVNNTGTFVTREGDGNTNIYEHTVENANVSVETSGYASLRELDGASQVTSEILGRAFFGGNLGVGVDIGGTYHVTDRLKATASVLDVGAIFHSKDVETYRARGSYTLNGIELIFPPLSDDETAIPYYENLGDEIEREIPVDTLNSGYSQWRPVKMNASLSYGFGRVLGRSGACDCLNMGGAKDYDQQVGVQYYSIFRNKGPQMAGTLFYYRRFANFLAAKATYTVDPYSASNIGVGLVADVGKVNFYIAADNLLKYGNIAKANQVSLQFGFNIKIEQQ